jgi:UDP-N-acetylglucosamine/UDP-N-acetylgalactosamine diphosphorylase
MAAEFPPALCHTLRQHGQGALLDQAAQWSEHARRGFRFEADLIDWELVERLYRSAIGRVDNSDDDPRTLAQRAAPPERLITLPRADSDRQSWRMARERGETALRAGQVAAVLVAGGQGTRLGSSDPKGMFSIGPLSGKSLYQWFSEQLLARQRRYGVRIPYAIMTSDATHGATVAYFQAHQCFGLNPQDVWFFSQANMPAVDAETGQALLAGPWRLAVSPDGHGGILAAMHRTGVLQQLAERGIETLYYHQVDNPTTPVCDPAFVGWHLVAGADVSTKVVAKKSAQERMGVAVTVDGRTRIIEYSDLPPELAAQVDDTGRLRFWAGNTAMHVFGREFLERAAEDDRALPFHAARKVVPYWTPEGPVTPEQPNAFKFERFIFDVLPWADQALVVEGDRSTEFNPVKNRDGDDSPATATAALQALHRQWVREAGGEIADDVPIEIGPLAALEADDLRPWIATSPDLTRPIQLDRRGSVPA